MNRQDRLIRRNAGNLGDLLIRMNMDFGITLILATHSQELAEKMKIPVQLFLREN